MDYKRSGLGFRLEQETGKHAGGKQTSWTKEKRQCRVAKAQGNRTREGGQGCLHEALGVGFATLHDNFLHREFAGKKRHAGNSTLRKRNSQKPK